MKKYCIVLLLALAIVSCDSKKSNDKYPRYTITKVHYVPDSLKEKHREYVNQIISSASYHMTGGDYEDTDVTIRQAKRTADELFGVTTVGLNKEIDGEYWHDIILSPEDMTPRELQILDSLI